MYIQTHTAQTAQTAHTHTHNIICMNSMLSKKTFLCVDGRQFNRHVFNLVCLIL